MKSPNQRQKFLDELRKVPVIQVACEKSGISRQTIYRWKREDSDFANQLEEYLAHGVEFVNDMAESQLLSQIKDNKFSAVRFWLSNNHKRFQNKTGRIHKSPLEIAYENERLEVQKQKLREDMRDFARKWGRN